MLKAMIGLGPDEALTYSPEWLKAFFGAMSGNAMIATTGDPEPELLADLDGERVGRAVPQEIVQIRMEQIRENNVNWCGVGAVERGLGDAGVRRAGRRAVVGEDRNLHAPRRARPRRGLARSHRPSQGTGRGSERPPRGRSALSRPRHRPQGRAAPERELARRRQRYVDRDPHTSRTCRPRKSSPRPTRDVPKGRSAPLCRCLFWARSCATSSSRSRTGEPYGSRRRPARSSCAATSRRSRTRTGWARSRSSRRSRGSARRGRSSTTRSSTRTRPATSRTARASPSSPTTTPVTD